MLRRVKWLSRKKIVFPRQEKQWCTDGVSMNKNISKQYKSKEHVSKTSPGKHCEMDKGVLDLSSDLHQLYLGLLSLSVISQGVVHAPE